MQHFGYTVEIGVSGWRILDKRQLVVAFGIKDQATALDMVEERIANGKRATDR